MTVSLVTEAPSAGLGAWEIDVQYDNSLLASTACASHPEGVCSKDFSPDKIRSSGHPAETLTGRLGLAEISFQATGPVGQCSPLIVQVVTFVDPEDVATSPAITGGEICIQDAVAPTSTPTPGPTPAPSPTPIIEPPCARFTDFDPDNFSDPTNIDNEWFPLVPGRKLVLTGVANGVHRRVVFIATDLTKVINGVRTMVLWDRDYQAGRLKEAELAFFAQDDDGNVWNLGEYPEEYEDGQFVGAPSTWIAGKADAEAGIQMLAEPNVGGPEYLQGWAPEIDFLDCAKVIATGDQVCVPVQCYDDSLVTEERSALDPAGGHQRKFHARDVGIVEITAVEDPEGETLTLKKNVDLGADQIAWAQREALKLEERAYQVSDVYADTPPAEPPSGTPTPVPTPTPTRAPSVPAVTVAAAQRPIPTVLAIAQPPARPQRPRFLPRFLPSAGGLPVSGWSTVGVMLPLGLGLALLAAFSRGYLRWGAAAEPNPLEDLDGEAVSLARIARLSRVRREALELESRAQRVSDFYRDTRSAKRRPPDD